VSEHIRNWFEWGFILQLISVFGCVISLAGANYGNESEADEVKKHGKVVWFGMFWMSMAQIIGNCAWVCVGSVIAFRFTGTTCTGYSNINTDLDPVNAYDFGIMYKSGVFMRVWLIANYVFYFFLCILIWTAAIKDKQNRASA
jgi:hypothetical protein